MSHDGGQHSRHSPCARCDNGPVNPDAPTPPLTFNLADLFESVVVEVPEAVAIIAGPRRLTFAELNDRSNQLANVLTARGVGAGDFVGLLLTNGTEYIEGMLACFKLAAVPVNVNYRYVDAELRHLFSDAGLVALIYDVVLEIGRNRNRFNDGPTRCSPSTRQATTAPLTAVRITSPP